MPEGKEVKSVGRITLLHNQDLIPGEGCYFCGTPCVPDGFDFIVEINEEKNFVCAACVKTNLPEIYQIHEDAHRWLEDRLDEAWRNGCREGKKDAIQHIKGKIQKVFTETIEERIMGVFAAEIAEIYDDMDSIPIEDLPF